MRGLLGAMREAGEEAERAPSPGLDDLGPLLDDVRRTGLTVNVHVEGEPVRLPAALDLSAYRVVQEGLTNVLKHAQAHRAEVVVRYRPDTLELEVRDDGRGPGRRGEGGHGLVGLRERVKIYAGSMDAGPAADRGFVLRTRFPPTVDPDDHPGAGRRSRGGVPGGVVPADGRADGHPDATAGRVRGDAADPPF